MPQAGGENHRKRIYCYFALFISSLIAVIALRCASLYFHLNVHSIDGAFQTISTLKRLSAGQIPFVDFFPYLGLIASSLPYPGYVLGGGTTLFASTLSSYATVAVSCGLATLFIFRMNRIGIVYAVITLALIYAATRFLLLDPGNSLRQLRALLPFVSAALIYFILDPDRINERRSSFRETFVWGLCLSFAPLWSNDFGAATVIGFALTWILLIADWKKRPLSSAGALALMLAVATAGAVLILATVSSVPNWWRFLPGAADYQFWYFGAWGETKQLLGIADLKYLLFMPSGMIIQSAALSALSVLSILARQLSSRQSVGDRLSFAIAISSFGGCLAAQVGGHITFEYWHASRLASGSILAIEAYKWAASFPFLAGLVANVRERLWRDGFFRLKPIDLLVALACLALILPSAGAAVRAAQRSDRSAEGEIARDRLGGFPRNDAREIACFSRLGDLLDRAGIPSDRRMASSYLSALNLAARADQPMQVDSIIHLLGDDFRTRNLAMLREAQPPLFTTIAASYSPWERWNERTVWPFFEYVYDNYEPVFRSEQHIVWLRKAAADATSVVGDPHSEPTCKIEQKGPRDVALTVSAPDIREPSWVILSADQKVRRTDTGFIDRLSRPILMVDEGPEYVFTEFGGASAHRYGVNANSPRLEIPVVVEPGKDKTIDLVVEPTRGWGVTVEACKATQRMPQVAEPVERIPMLGDCQAFLDRVSDRLTTLGYNKP
jgi:hypothetical protein